MANILIVDDDPMMADMLSAFLRIMKHDSAAAYTCQQAWDKLTWFTADAVLLDIMLPDMNGLEMCRALHDRQETKHLPVIMVSAVEPPLRAEAAAAGASGYLSKPVTIAELREALAAAGIA
jgi:DNA-binding response OmpR family regulator